MQVEGLQEAGLWAFGSGNFSRAVLWCCQKFSETPMLVWSYLLLQSNSSVWVGNGDGARGSNLSSGTFGDGARGSTFSSSVLSVTGDSLSSEGVLLFGLLNFR